MRPRLPSNSVVVGGYALFAMVVAAVAMRWRTDTVLYLLFVPVIFAAILYPRLVFQAMLLTSAVASTVAVTAIFKKPHVSQRNVVLFSLLLLVVAEALHRLKTARDRTERALRESENRLRTIIEAEPDCVTLLAADGTVLEMNPAGLAMIEAASAEEFRGRSVHPLVLARHREAFRALTEGCFRGVSGTLEFEMAGLKGTKRWIQTRAVPLRDEHGVITSCLAVSTDVTERKRVESRSTAFSRLGQQLSATNTPEDAARLIVSVAKELLGWDACTLDLYSAEEDLIQPLVSIDTIDGRQVDVAHPSAGREPSSMMRRVMAQGGQLILRDASAPPPPALTPFGDRARLSASLMFVPVRNGQRVIGSLSAQSYTAQAYTREDLDLLQALADHCGGALERLHAAHELRRSEERFAKAFRSSPVAMGISSMKEDRFLDANDSLVRLLGYSREEIVGRTAAELAIWVQTGAREQRLAHAAEQNPVRELECPLRTKDGKIRSVLVSAETIESGSEACLLSIFQDVTERLNLETQLRHAQKMEAIGQLSSGVAHDFNNIMTIIQGHTNLLLRSQEIDAAMKDSLNQVFLAAERAATLTRQLLAFSRKQIMRAHSLDLNEVVAHAARMLHRLLGENVDLQFQYAPQLPPVHADMAMLEQVIVNMALNARDAMPNGGRLAISTRLVAIDAAGVQRNPEARLGRFVCLSLQDTGCGMDAETLSRIFEPFFTTKEVGRGTGLGLPMVYGIVKQHQGWVEVESQVGHGSTFHVFLPSCSRRPAAPPPEPQAMANAPDARGGTETILVVEDEKAVRELVRRVLEVHGYRVISAANGKEALEIWSQHRSRIDLLLTDMVMPEGISGLELSRTLKSERTNLKVIYTSGYSMELYTRNMDLQEGVNFLPKPYHPRRLAQAVRRCLDG